MTWLDYAVLTILAASILWGVWRGLVHEVVSVAAWVLAFLAANLLAGLTALPRQPAWRNAVSGDSLAQGALALRPWLPQSFAGRLRYH